MFQKKLWSIEIKKQQKQSQQTVHRSAFTLLELLVTITLLSLVCASLGIAAHKALQQQHFQNASKGVLEKMQLAKELAVQLDTPATLFLTLSEAGLNWRLELAQPTYQRYQLTGKPFKGVASLIQNDKQVDELQLIFSRFGTPLLPDQIELQSYTGEIALLNYGSDLAKEVNFPEELHEKS